MSGIGARLVALLARVSFKQLLLVAVAAVILASGLFGGLERAETTEIEALKVGRAVDTGPFDLTVERGRHTTEIESSAFPSAPPARSVVVVATVRNRSDRSVSAATLRDSVRLSGVAGLLDDGRRAKKGADVRPQVLLPADGSALSTVVPGVTYEVAFVWDQAVDSEPPSSVGVEIRSHTRRKSTIDGQQGWFDPTAVRRGSVAVEEVS
ncbi:hypothetical protein ASD11_06520 [Aeromicrobium sp. Root495]|uniref:hypothetical protein n=1 Tax=Aeromicrobium sp. Root495 TaxID=1736550 RepID=UPI0006F92FFE|nr:hypothetical protein [Aeromicrobium sp. Root495]KQY59230.1 hypothetical protein ASD11_06520 [Aeromicrobium sp. Root495]